MKNLFDPHIILVTGGAASGKSALAEEICCSAGNRRLYIATMQPFGEEAHARIERHRALRAGKGFDTFEYYRDLDTLMLDEGYDVALLEDMGNLVANHLFGGDSSEAEQRIVNGIAHVAEQVKELVVVANEVFCSSQRFDCEIQAYLQTTARVQREVAQRAVCVIESVCGLPQILRGELVH